MFEKNPRGLRQKVKILKTSNPGGQCFQRENIKLRAEFLKKALEPNDGQFKINMFSYRKFLRTLALRAEKIHFTTGASLSFLLIEKVIITTKLKLCVLKPCEVEFGSSNNKFC